MRAQTRPMEEHIGQRIKQQHVNTHLSQDDLAKFIALTFQKIQKYEHALKRINAHAFYEICLVLQQHPGWFLSKFTTHAGKKIDEVLQTKHIPDREMSLHNMVLRSINTILPPIDFRPYYKLLRTTAQKP